MKKTEEKKIKKTNRIKLKTEQTNEIKQFKENNTKGIMPIFHVHNWFKNYYFIL